MHLLDSGGFRLPLELVLPPCGQDLGPLVHPAGEALGAHRLSLQFDELWPQAQLPPAHPLRNGGGPGAHQLRKALVVGCLLIPFVLPLPCLLLGLTKRLACLLGGV